MYLGKKLSKPITAKVETRFNGNEQTESPVTFDMGIEFRAPFLAMTFEVNAGMPSSLRKVYRVRYSQSESIYLVTAVKPQRVRATNGCNPLLTYVELNVLEEVTRNVLLVLPATWAENRPSRTPYDLDHGLDCVRELVSTKILSPRGLAPSVPARAALAISRFSKFGKVRSVAT